MAVAPESIAVLQKHIRVGHQTLSRFRKRFGDKGQICNEGVADIDLVQTSCGFGVPMYEYTGERDIHFEWAEKKGADGLYEYVQQNNLVSLDGLPTQLSLK